MRIQNFIFFLVVVNLNLIAQEPEKTVFDELGEPFNLTDFKLPYHKNSTSAILNKRESENLFKPDSLGFFGSYSLFNKQNEFRGYLIIHTTEDAPEWRFDSKKEIFIAIETNSKDVKMWDVFFVGLSEKSLA